MEQVASSSPFSSSSSKSRSKATILRLVIVQFGLLLWKNTILQIRRPFGTIFEIVTPLVTVSILVILRFGVFNLTDQCFVTYNSDPLVIPTIDPYIVYYAPNTTEINDFADNFMAPLLATSGGSVQGVPTNDDIFTAYENSNVTRTRGCFLGGSGVYFNEFSGNNIQFSIRLRYVTREGHWHLGAIGATLELAGPRHVPYFYLDEGFMHLQKIVSEAIIHYRTGQPFNMNVETRQIPSLPYTRDFFVFSLDILLPFLIGISFVYSAGTFVKELVYEKQSRTREVMKIMGLSDWILWMTWFLKQFCFIMPLCILFAIALKFGLILIYSNLFLVIVFFVFFVTSGIAFCFLLSSFFSSATLGILASILTWSGLYLIHFFLNPFYDTIPFALKVILSLLSSNICSGFGIQIISKLEQERRGLNYNTFFTPVSFSDTQFNMGVVILLMFIDTVLYMFLNWYINAVFPGQYGIRKPFYFIFLPSYWTGRKYKNKNNTIEEIQLETLKDDHTNHEAEPLELEVGISIKNLSKIFNPKSKKSRVVAVNNLSLKMYKGQITALLGHNGAGKTTTMNMLSGFYSPTSGSASINGLSISTDMDLIRHDLGLCPQHNVLFDRLTVLEHLKFYIRLKGVSGDVMDEIDDMIDDLELDDKADVQSKNLSGGMKRKLSVAIALIGGSKFVVLDEPTSGMDPYTRRITWDLLIKHKHNRTILLTTQFMDEADILGDRIAIMKSGYVKTSGSSLFLKKRFGCGYHLTIEKIATHSDSDPIIALVNQLVDDSKFLYDIGAEVSLLLPDSSAHQFPSLLDTLEAKKDNLGISSFGLSVTTMEEVFLQVGRDEEEVIEKKVERRRSQLLKAMSTLSEIPLEEEVDTPKDSKDVKTPPPQYEGYNKGVVLQFQQFYALLVKHFYYFSRFWLGIVFSIILPIASVLLALLVAKFDSSSTEAPSSLNLRFPDLAEEPNNITLFWANIDSTLPFNFGAANASVFSATNFFEFTSEIQSIRSSVQNITNINDCCNYKYQILDKFCASRLTDELQVCSNSNFGYNLCMNCLSCCQAKSNKIPSCTDPTAESLYPASDVFCPAPPILSLADQRIVNPTGPLDNINTYVAERLLQYSEEISVGVFEQIFQGGFVFHSSLVSPYSTCGCEDITETCQYLTPALLSSAANAPTAAFTSIDSFLTDFCSAFNASVPDCTVPQIWNSQYSGTLGVCIDQASCDVRQYQCQCSNSSQCQYGETSPDTTANTVGTVTVWYNHKAYHTAPVVLNSFYNLYLSSINSSLSLSVINDPFPIPLAVEVFQMSRTIQTHSITIAVTVGLGFSFLYASITILLTKEKEEKSKHLQFVGGVHSVAYWLSSYLKDGLINLLVLIITIALFAAIQVQGFTGNSLGAISLMIVFCTWTCHSIAYICTFIFSNALLGFTIFFILLAFPAIMMNAVIFVILEGRQVDINVIDYIHYVFCIHPVYGFSSGLFNLYNNGANGEVCMQSALTAAICEASNIRFASNIFQLAVPGVGHILIILAIEALLSTVLLFAIQRGFFIQEITWLTTKIRKNKPAVVTESNINEDKDISDERLAVSQLTNFKDYSIVIHNVRKEYGSFVSKLFPCCRKNTKLAVNDISFVVDKGECFGLLGVNGAGKTTTFKMLTGDISVSSGSAFVAGYNISTQLNSAQQHMGYCPQFDALIELMTGREMLTMFARLKGIREKDIPDEVETEIKRLNLFDYADKRCGTYSGGNKRKLSTAIALVGRPPIVFLDEPTTGMDPVTRRFVWNAIIGVIQEGRSVILTSHSMEECEALCTKLTIMVKGSLRALGSVQHLKHRYTSGYLLQVKVDLNATQFDNMRRKSTRRNRRTKRNQSYRGRNPVNDGTIEQQLSEEESSRTNKSKRLRRTVTQLYRRATSRQFEQLEENKNELELATEEANMKILQLFPKSTLAEKYLGYLAYELKSDGITWSEVFRIIEDNKHTIGILDYSVSQPTLEKVFLGFAQD